MSYDCVLIDPITREPLKASFKHQITGGTYAIGGTEELWLNVTFNYSKFLYRVLPKGIPGLDGIKAIDSIPILEKGISQLSDDIDDDYWKPTEGNTKKALYGLLALAKIRPDGVWEILY